MERKYPNTLGWKTGKVDLPVLHCSNHIEKVDGFFFKQIAKKNIVFKKQSLDPTSTSLNQTIASV